MGSPAQCCKDVADLEPTTKRARKLHQTEAKPAAWYKARSVKTAAFSVGTAARVQCKREASRIRRAIEADRSANDIAKQVMLTRERKSSEHVKRSSV